MSNHFSTWLGLTEKCSEMLEFITSQRGGLHNGPASSEPATGEAHRLEGVHDKSESRMKPPQVELAHEPASLVLH